MQIPQRLVWLGFLCLTWIAHAADEDKKTRVGTCADAKKQQEYFCGVKMGMGGIVHAATDSMAALGPACGNAKVNVKEACEGVVAPNLEYKFCTMEKKC